MITEVKKKTITINKETVKAKNCPLCGKPAYINIRKWNDCWGMGTFVPTTGAKVVCKNCGCNTSEYTSTGQSPTTVHKLCIKVLNIWNNRV